jgi:predicted NBD/HSP70 family sugar kinase
MRGPVSARAVFAAAAKGDERARTVVADEALLVAKAITAVVAVADPELVVLGGGVGQAEGFLDLVAAQVRPLAPVLPELRVSALGTAAVVDGCLAAGLDRAWQIVTAALPHLAPVELEPWTPNGTPRRPGPG